MSYRNTALLGLARLAPRCMACGVHNHGQVVAAHRNESKGIGMKCPDFAWAAMCATCHFQLDQGSAMHREDRRAFWNLAFWKTLEWLWTSGFIVVCPPGYEPPPEPVKAKIAKPKRLIASRPFQQSETPRKIASRPFPKRTPK